MTNSAWYFQLIMTCSQLGVCALASKRGSLVLPRAPPIHCRYLRVSEWRFIQMTAKPPAIFLHQPIKQCTRVSAANRLPSSFAGNSAASMSYANLAM